MHFRDHFQISQNGKTAHLESLDSLPHHRNLFRGQYSTLITQRKLKSKLDQMEQKSLDHCLVIRGIPEGPNEGEREFVHKIYVELANTVESNEENNQLIMARRMEIKRACRIRCYNPQYSRPLSVEFKYRLDTDYIMENRGYLNEGVYVDREYTEEIET